MNCEFAHDTIKRSSDQESRCQIQILNITDQLPDQKFHLAVLIETKTTEISRIVIIPGFAMYNSEQMTNSIPTGGVVFVINDLQLNVQGFKSFSNKLATIIIKVRSNSLGNIDCYASTDYLSQFTVKLFIDNLI